MSSLAIARLQKEVTMLMKDPPHGAWAGPIEGKPLTELEARIQGPAGTVYESGVFKLSVNIPTRYPMEPPKVRFITPVYHPNIDAEGRICLDILNPPPKGAWKPSLNISTVLASIALLLADPNPDDGLVTETTYEYKHQRDVFDSKARAWTRQHAVQLKGAIDTAGGPSHNIAATPADTIAIENNTEPSPTNSRSDKASNLEADFQVLVKEDALRDFRHQSVPQAGSLLAATEPVPDAPAAAEENTTNENALEEASGKMAAVDKVAGVKQGQQRPPLSRAAPPKRSKLSLQR